MSVRAGMRWKRCAWSTSAPVEVTKSTNWRASAGCGAPAGIAMPSTRTTVPVAGAEKANG